MNRDHPLFLLLMLWTVVTLMVMRPLQAEPNQEAQSQIEPEPLDCVINPSVIADLGSGVPGVLDEIRVDRSDFVRAGDVVAQLESGVEVAARDLARLRASKDTEVELRRVNAAFGRRQYARSEDLFKRKVISTNDIDERKTEAQVAGIQLRQAQDNKELAELELARAEQVLKRRTILSPISGVVMERFKTIGEYVDEQPVLRVAQLNPLHVEVFVPVEKLGQIRPGMRADVWSDSVTGSDWEAEVSRVDLVADVASATYGVRLVLANPDYKVPAGLRCRLRFDANSLADASDEMPFPAPTPDTASRQPSEPVGDVDDEDAAESKAAGVTTEPGTSTPSIDVAAADDASVLLCRELGPFDDRAGAERAAKGLRSEGLDVRLIERRTGKRVGYRVVSRLFDERSDAEALVARLRAARIEDYYLQPQSEPPLRVALGLYNTKATAERRVRSLAKSGITAELLAWHRGPRRYVLAVSGKASSATVAQIDALPVASGEAGDSAESCAQLAGR